VRTQLSGGTALAFRPVMSFSRRLAARCFALALLAVASGASAVPLAVWDIAGATGQSATLGFTAPGITAGNLVAVGVTPWPNTTQNGFVAAAGWAPGATPDPGRYFEWSITAGAGTAIQFDTLTLALLRGIQGANHGAQLWDLRASTDGFGASDVLLQTLDITGSGADTQVIFTVDLSTLGTQSGTVTFRLYGYDYTSAADYSGFGNDSGWLIAGTGANLGVDGGVVTLVPEPGTALLLAAGLAALGYRPRSRTSSSR
jgi:hypothetical protein